jgi:opacity protein-like surface antigen
VGAESVESPYRLSSQNAIGNHEKPVRRRLVPYAGGGAGRLRYKETSQFAEEAENVRFTRTSYHIVGGAEVRVWRWIGAAAEVRYRSVRNAIGQAGVSHDFHEEDLGGTEVRVKIIAGR